MQQLAEARGVLRRRLGRRRRDECRAPALARDHVCALSDQSITMCRHCGLPCEYGAVSTDNGPFCCVGCEAVFDLLAAQHLTGYYSDCPVPPGVSQKDRARRAADRFAGLDDPEVAARVVQFDDGRTAVATFAVPSVHCGSCVYLLEQLWRFDQLADGTWRIMPKSIPNSKEAMALSAIGSSFATLSKFHPASEKQRWLFKTP